MRISHTGANMLVQTPAKINLSLKVLGKREDGYHELETLMISVRLYDSIRFEVSQSEEIKLSVNLSQSPQQTIPTDGNNLVVKAANLLKEFSKSDSGVQMHLTKRIPSEAGLGGGSSDAAATLVCLNKLWKLNLSSKEIHELATQLGSDINFFIDSHPAAFCTGRGEQITAVPLARPLHIIIVKPKGGLSTGSVFNQWKQSAQVEQNSGMKINDLLNGSLKEISDRVFNSLQQPARELNAEVDSVLNLFKKHDVLAAGMSGSGTACFGICRTHRHANRIAAKIKSQSDLKPWILKTGV